MSQLIIFLSIYFAVYGTLHLYVLIKLRRAYYLEGLPYGFLSLLLLFVLMAPIQSRVLDALGLMLPATISAWIGFVWMGFLFLFVCLSLPMDGYHLLISFGQTITGRDLTHLMWSRRQSVTVACIVAGCLMVYGAFEAGQLRTETVTIETSKIPVSKERIRIVQVSDLHVGYLRYPGRLDAVVSAIEAAQPDLLVSTGDLVDGRIHDASDYATRLHALPAPLGKLAVTGNHEFYGNIESALDFTQAAGFTLLRDSTLAVGKHLTVVGVDDPARGADPARTDEKALLGKTTANRFVLLLKHRPTIAPGSRFDLQLSGHTHKGQIFPFTLLVQLRYPMYAGLHRLNSSSHLYISRGTGTWGPPIRVLSPPEITIIDLIPTKKVPANQ